MKMRCLLFALATILASCTADRSANPRYTGCTTNDECAGGETCASGFCIPGERADGGLDAGPLCPTEDVCYDGPDGTRGVGVCRPGCLQDVEGERICVGQVLPGAEVCNGEDDDCDSSEDEDFTLDSPEQCGACDVSCATGEMCCQRSDGSVTECANLATSMNHCGGCGQPCEVGEACCGTDGCVQLADDPANCGACGNACGAGQICCDSRCVDPRSSNEHCGGCGNMCAGTAADMCCPGDAGAPPDCRPDTDCATCAGCTGPGQLCCGGTCVDSQTDAANCGACGAACDAGETCCGGVCRTPEEACGSCSNPCSTGELCCDGECTGVTDDRTNCGGCGITCAAGRECCNGSCVDLQTDNLNCGVCGEVCAGEVCAMGTCCPAGHIPCPGRGCVRLGTETDCATCGNACSGGLCNCAASGSSFACSGLVC